MCFTSVLKPVLYFASNDNFLTYRAGSLKREKREPQMIHIRKIYIFFRLYIILSRILSSKNHLIFNQNRK